MKDLIDATDTALILFLAGESPSSCRARANLHSALNQKGFTSTQVMEVNILEQPGLALQRRVFATPALLTSRSDDGTALYGDLSEQNALMRFLEGALVNSQGST